MRQDEGSSKTHSQPRLAACRPAWNRVSAASSSHQGADMSLHRPLMAAELARDRLVREPCCQQLEHDALRCRRPAGSVALRRLQATGATDSLCVVSSGDEGYPGSYPAYNPAVPSGVDTSLASAS